MQNIFKNFYSHINDEKIKLHWPSKTTIFIFDTNTLLDLYRYRPKTQKEFFKYVDKIQDRIWMPHHVGVELHENRLKVIKQHESKIKSIDSQFKKLCQIDFNEITTFESDYKKSEYPELYTIIDKLKNTLHKNQKDITELVENAKLEMKESLELSDDFKPDFLAHKDQILQKLETLYSADKIGINLYDTQEKIEHLFSDAKRRWEAKIPPGYEDYEVKKSSYFCYNALKYYKSLGDLIIFNEIKELTKNNDIQQVIFISNDVKSDWKLIVDYQGKKDLGARPELHNELIESGGNVKYFEILTTQQFLTLASQIQGETLSDEIIKDIDSSQHVLPPQLFDVKNTRHSENQESIWVNPQESAWNNPQENVWNNPQENVWNNPQENVWNNPQENVWNNPQENVWNNPQENAWNNPQGNAQSSLNSNKLKIQELNIKIEECYRFLTNLNNYNHSLHEALQQVISSNDDPYHTQSLIEYYNKEIYKVNEEISIYNSQLQTFKYQLSLLI